MSPGGEQADVSQSELCQEEEAPVTQSSTTLEANLLQDRVGGGGVTSF